MFEAGQRISEEKMGKRSSKSSVRSSVKSRSSKISRPSTTLSRGKALQAKARKAELATKLEAESVRLQAEYVAAAAISKVYENAIKEDEEQYLSSDDPDPDDNLNPMGLSPVDRLDARSLGKPYHGKGIFQPYIELWFVPMYDSNTPLSH